MDADHLSMNVMGVFNIQDDSQNTMVSEVVWIDIPEPLGDTIMINAGGDMFSGYYADQVWGSDKEYGFIAGNFQSINNNVDIHNTDNDIVYRSSLNRVASYKGRLKPGSYTLKMLFSENHYSSPNDRVFDIVVEDNLVVNDLDVLSHVSINTAYDIILNNIEVVDGVLDIYFSADIYGVGYAAAGPFINGLEIYLEDALISTSSNPNLFKLEKPFPNPFNNRVSIPIITSQKSDISIRVFDLIGRKVDTVFEGIHFPGKKHFIWDARIVANGIYIIQSIINGKKYYDKVVFLK